MYCQTLRASQLDFENYFTRLPHTYLDVIHIAIVCGKRDLLELRIGSIRSLDLLDLTCLSASQQGQCDESIWPAA